MLFLAEDLLGDLGENGDDVFFESFELGKVVGELLVDESEFLEELELMDDLVVLELALCDLLEDGFDGELVVFVLGEGSEVHVGGELVIRLIGGFGVEEL